MGSFEQGEMGLCMKVLDEQRKLDEMVVLACAVLQRMRTKIRKHGARSVGTGSGGVDAGLAKASFKAGWQVASLAAWAGGGGGA